MPRARKDEIFQFRASVETDKVVREKLEQAYNRALQLPRLATDFNMAVAQTTTKETFYGYLVRGEVARSRLDNELTLIQTTNNLYVPEITKEVEALAACYQTFTECATTHALLEVRDAGGDTPTLSSYADRRKPLQRVESLNTTAHSKLACDEAVTDLNNSIAGAMRQYR